MQITHKKEEALFTYGNSRSEFFFKIGVFKNLANFTENHSKFHFEKVSEIKAYNFFLKWGSNVGVLLWNWRNF